MGRVLKQFFSVIEHYTELRSWTKKIEWVLTEDDGGGRRPAGGVREHGYTVKHDTDGECIVDRCAGTRQGAIEICVHQYCMVLCLGGAVGHAYDDVGEVWRMSCKVFCPSRRTLEIIDTSRKKMSRCVGNAPMTAATSLVPHLTL